MRDPNDQSILPVAAIVTGTFLIIGFCLRNADQINDQLDSIRERYIRRPFARLKHLQVRLSTLIVLMFTAGAILHANLSPMFIDELPSDSTASSSGFRIVVRYAVHTWKCNGWPFTFRYCPVLENEMEQAGCVWRYPAFFEDIAIDILLLGLITYLCEFLSSNREARRPGGDPFGDTT